MAIKGKSKSRSKRSVTPGPKPVYVEPKLPFFMRRKVQVSLSFVAGILVVLFALWVRDGLRSEHQRTEGRQRASKQRTAVAQFQRAVDAALRPIGQAVPPDGFSALPGLQTNLDGLGKGDVSAKDAESAAKAGGDAAMTASKAIAGIDVAGLIRGKGFSLGLTNYVFNSQSKLTHGLDLFEQVALSLEQAARTDGDERASLVTSAKGVLEVAQKVFAEGYSDYVQALSAVNLFVPQFPQPPPAPSPAS